MKILDFGKGEISFQASSKKKGQWLGLDYNLFLEACTSQLLFYHAAESIHSFEKKLIAMINEAEGFTYNSKNASARILKDRLTVNGNGFLTTLYRKLNSKPFPIRCSIPVLACSWSTSNFSSSFCGTSTFMTKPRI
ncbi:MAG: hypothetical protein HQM15_07095 [Deltaproteobacteria bacterium]|nr:hypothetical protein [Deltaproteobacteria bacterium]